MTIPVSDKPVLKGNSITLAVGSNYAEVLRVEVDPTHLLYIDSLEIDVNDPTWNVLVNVLLNGTPKLENYPIINSSLKFGFGRHWLVDRHKVPIVIQAKATAQGTVQTTCTISASASGVESY